MRVKQVHKDDSLSFSGQEALCASSKIKNRRRMGVVVVVGGVSLNGAFVV